MSGIERLSHRVWEVKSTSKEGVKYVVFFDWKGWHCNCKGGWIYGNCKHIDAVKKEISGGN